MTKDELKALGLTDEQVEKITDDIGRNFVAKSQFNAKNRAERENRAKIGQAQAT